jgi:hypothetical protein
MQASAEFGSEEIRLEKRQAIGLTLFNWGGEVPGRVFVNHP